MDPADRIRRSPEVSLRPERFGALAYHFGNRTLSFLKHPDLVRTVELLDGSATVGEALDAAGVDRARWPSFLAALDTLERSGMVVRVDDAPGRDVSVRPAGDAVEVAGARA